MKKKILSIFLCFTIILSSFNFSFANERDPKFAPAIVSIAPEIVSSIGAFIVASGGTIIGQKMLNDATRHFYNDNEDNWDNVVETFKRSVSIAKDGLVKIGSEFLSLLNNTFSKLNVNDESSGQNISHTGSYYGIPEISVKPLTGSSVLYVEGLGISISDDIVCGNIFFDVQGTTLYIKNNTTGVSQYTLKNYSDFLPQFLIYDNFLYIYHINGSSLYFSKIKDLSYFGISDESILDLPSISSDSLQLESDNSICVGVPDTLDKFVDGTVNYDNIYNPSYPLTNGNVGVGSMPGVSNPSIEYGDSLTIPNSGVIDTPVDPPVDTPVDSIWTSIRDFIISLVVPSDTFWTDTWNGLYNSFISAFPGVDMDGFNSLVTGEKKFPNIDINIMGVKGRVVNGDVINSIVDWLRPIIAGFMMLCLMFFNYRKIYKLIRNSEPFGGIAPGTSDFSTGISEYSDNYLKAKEIIGENLRSMTGKGVK